MINLEIKLLFYLKVGSAQEDEISFSPSGELNCCHERIQDYQVEMSLLSLAFLLCTEVVLLLHFILYNILTTKDLCLFCF